MAKTPVTKPTPTDHEWFEAGAGPDKVTPADALIESGYHAPPDAIPAMEEFNFWFQKWDRLCRYYIEKGLPDWDAAETYQVGDMIRYNGIFYVCFAAPTVGVTPDTNEFSAARKWERYFATPFGGPASDTIDKKVWTWFNRSGFAGSEIDRLGYVNGDHVVAWDETWDGFDAIAATGTSTFVQSTRRWIAGLTTVNVDGWIKVIDPSATLPVRCLNLRLGTDGTDKNTHATPVLTRFRSGNQISIDFRIRTGGTIDHERLVGGLSDGGADLAATGAFVGGFFYYDVGSTRLFFVSGDGTTLGTAIDTGVVVAINTDYVMRIEWLGATLSNDATDQLRFYVNGSLVARLTNALTGHLPNAAATPKCCVMFAAAANGGAGGIRDTFISPVRFRAYY